jgi:hypothetical protein
VPLWAAVKIWGLPEPLYVTGVCKSVHMGLCVFVNVCMLQPSMCVDALDVCTCMWGGMCVHVHNWGECAYGEVHVQLCAPACVCMCVHVWLHV